MTKLPPLFPQRPTGKTPTLNQVRTYDNVVPPNLHGLLGIASLAVFLYMFRQHGEALGWTKWGHGLRGFYACLSAIVPMALWAVFVDRVHERPGSGLDRGLVWAPPTRAQERWRRLGIWIPTGLLMVALFGAIKGWWTLGTLFGGAYRALWKTWSVAGISKLWREWGVGFASVGVVKVTLALITAAVTTALLNLSGGKEPLNYQRSAVKFLGLLGCFALGGFLYWLFPEYGMTMKDLKESFYYSFYVTLGQIWPWLLALAPAYILYVDRRMRDPQDGYWNLGMLLMGFVEGRDWAKLKELIAGWLVKIFFLPLMFLYFAGKVGWAVNPETVVPFHSWGELWDQLTNSGIKITDYFKFYHFVHTFIMMFDVAFGAIGYAMTFRLFDSHVRTAEPTMFGWVIAVMCYNPFWGNLFSGRFLLGYSTSRWEDGREKILFDHPTLLALVGFLVLALFTVYVWSTVSFGLRFSNLTHRGILTHGPYRWLKHPAYVSKNTAWWLMAMPFIAKMEWSDALRSSLLLLAVNSVYLLRALTEERNLGQDPGYRAYQAYMYEHGLYALLIRRPLRMIAGLKY
jgi:isoprenylcysteine carboxyl methyltransferase (ICMT) family protein YpbQ